MYFIFASNKDSTTVLTELYKEPVLNLEGHAIEYIDWVIIGSEEFGFEKELVFISFSLLIGRGKPPYSHLRMRANRTH